jgi:hypothetical protein
MKEIKNILIYTYSFYPKIDGVTIRYKNLITEFRDDYHLVLEILIYTLFLVGLTDGF